jgi:diguanylate cyclase (GGDEF)-like protein/putative nucleotidyltransferase with HDIG domain
MMSESVNTAAFGATCVEIITISPGNSVKDAAAKMLSHNVGCLIVVDDQGKFIGLITERDIARHVAVSPDYGAGIRVREIMTDRVVSCPPGIAASEATRIMMTHRIRHLPLVENGSIVGILSSRDIMSQQLIEDRAAAEEVAMLSKCLKSIDLSEAAEIVAAEAPKLFEACNSVLCLYPEADRTREPELTSSNRCPCVGGHLTGPQNVETTSAQGGPEGAPALESHFDVQIPAECARCGGKAPRVVLPLDIVGLPEFGSGKEKRLGGFLCMCGLPASSLANRELMQYKAKLTREILVAHLTNATRYQQARLTSLTDALTGVGSRKLLEDKLHEEHDRAIRYKRPFSVAIIDLDHFKMINDSVGHAVGDEAIRKLAECVRQEKRDLDVLARYGGDEFVLLLPETNAEEAGALLERVRARVRDICFDNNDKGPAAENQTAATPNDCAARPSDPSPPATAGPSVRLSISCGVAENMLDAAEIAGDVMRRADVALYEAKNAGRNCVKLWSQEMTRLANAGDIEIERIKKLQRRIMGLSEKAEKLFMESIWSLVQALEAKDTYAGKHSENVTTYAVGIARMMELGPKYVDLIRRSAMIHDIGKIGIPDAVLFKPDHLTAHERRVIEQHPLIAVRILEKMSFLENEIAIIRHHHEKWNGQGYPDGLARTAIPLGARVIAAADVFDALTSSRAYHASRSVHEVLAMLKDSSGYEFDPTVVVAMIAWVDSISRESGIAVDRLTIEDLLAASGPMTESQEPAAPGNTDNHEQAPTLTGAVVHVCS